MVKGLQTWDLPALANPRDGREFCPSINIAILPSEPPLLAILYAECILRVYFSASYGHAFQLCHLQMKKLRPYAPKGEEVWVASW